MRSGVRCIVTDPGAAGEAAHHEGANDACSAPDLLTVVIALNLVEFAMGPTLVWPKSHTADFLARVREHGAAAAMPMGLHLDMDAGDALVLDPRTWRREGPNSAHASFPWMTELQRRAVLVATFSRTRATLGSSPGAAQQADVRAGDDDLSGALSLLALEPSMRGMPATQRSRAHRDAAGLGRVLKAAGRGELETVLAWLESGGPVDGRGGANQSTMLMRASAGGHMHVLEGPRSERSFS